jgi:hypothetical protein
MCLGPLSVTIHGTTVDDSPTPATTHEKGTDE